MALTSPISGHIDGRDHLVIQRLDGGGQPTVAPPSGDADFGWLHWANNDRVVFTVSATRKRVTTETTETRLWAINRDGSGGGAYRHTVENGEDRFQSRQGAPACTDPGQHCPLAAGRAASHHGDARWRSQRRPRGSQDRHSRRHGTISSATMRVGIQDWVADHTGRLRFGWGYRNSIAQGHDQGRKRHVAFRGERRNGGTPVSFPQGFSGRSGCRLHDADRTRMAMR